MAEQKKQSRLKRSGALWPLLASAALVLAVIVGAVVWATDRDGTTGEETESAGQDTTGQDTTGQDGAGQDESQEEIDEQTRAFGEMLARRDGDDPTALGEEDAPVVLIAYSDYQCPYCATWVEEVQPELVERYVEPGDMRIEWREFPYMDETSRVLSVGAHAAGEQGGFWEYHEAVYGDQDTYKGEDPDDLAGRLTEVAEEQGLDPERFADDLADDELAASVDEDFTEGQQIGVSGTPAFIINGAPVFGAQPVDVFTGAIDTALAAQG